MILKYNCHGISIMLKKAKPIQTRSEKVSKYEKNPNVTMVA